MLPILCAAMSHHLTPSNSQRKLKDTEKVWQNYKSQKAVMTKLLEDAEAELVKIVPKHSHKKIQSDLKVNKEMRDDIKKCFRSLSEQ